MLEKIADILTLARKPVLKDHIIRKCNLNSSDFSKYVTQLLQGGLLNAYPAINLKHVPGRKTRHRMIYQTSRKGRLFLKRYNELLMLLQPVERVRARMGRKMVINGVRLV